MKDRIRRTIAVALAVITICVVAPAHAFADPDTTNCLYPSPTDRFGVTVPGNMQITWYNVDPLTIGRHLNWRADFNPARPNGIDYYFMVRTTEAGFYPGVPVIQRIARNNPGGTYIIGNEADVVHQDNTSPAAYVRAYHDAYTAIKAVDPTARFVANGIVMVSPLRLAWLQQVWDTYRTTYGTDMPVDIWNVHTYIGNEMHQEWGFEVPPGIDNAVGYSLYLGTHWAQANDSGASGGTVHQSRTVDARAYFAFRGNQVTLFLRTGPDSGIAKIYLDHAAAPVAEVDLYAPTPGTLTRTYSNLAPPGGILQDRHNIRVEVTGRKNPASSDTWVRVDAIQAPSTATLPNGRFEDNSPLRATIMVWVEDHDNLDMIVQQIRDFRRWMDNNDQRNKPLINTEYGILMSEELGFTYQRVQTFMLESFNRFLNLTGPALGYPEDGNRLLQEWFWFAIALTDVEGYTNNSGLYDPWTKAIKPLGQDFANYIQQLYVPYVDLQLDQALVTPYWPIFAGGDVTLRIEPTVRNRGNRSSGPFSVTAKDANNNSTIVNLLIDNLPKRFLTGHIVSRQHDWRVALADQYSVRVIVDEANQVTEPCGTNNELVVQVIRPQGTDLALSNLRTEPAFVPPIPAAATTTVTLRVNLSNLGGAGTSAPDVQVTFWNGDPAAGGQQIGVQTLSASATTLPAEITFQWPGRSRGWHQVYARVEQVPEDTNLANNTQQLTFLVPGGNMFLPEWQRNTKTGRQADEQVIEDASASAPIPVEWLPAEGP